MTHGLLRVAILTDGAVESTHDEITGEMKLCETEKTYSIMDSERKRKVRFACVRERKKK